MVLAPTTTVVGLAAAALRRGELVGFPTETVYGLGADADNEAAVAKIFDAKGRPRNHPLIVHVSAHDGGLSGMAHYAAQTPDFAQQLMSAFWPGPLTLILPRLAGVGAVAAGGQASIGLRCPSHPVAQALLQALRQPGADEPVVWGLAAPSANRFGRVSPTTAAHVTQELGHDLLVLEGGACEVGIESTIIDCTRGQPVLLRPGAITAAQAQAACGQAVMTEQEFAAHRQARDTGLLSHPPSAQRAPSALSAPRASGTLESHYAPNAQVRLMEAVDLQTAITLLGRDLEGGKARIAVYARAALTTPSGALLMRRMPDDAAATAQQLFAVLREFDAQGVGLIWVETPPDQPDWAGVRDRLQRAAA
jgi:L-threonylcarbamoyladenylate synthase